MKCPAEATEGRAESPINCNMYNWKYPQGNVLKLGDTHKGKRLCTEPTQNGLKRPNRSREEEGVIILSHLFPFSSSLLSCSLKCFFIVSALHV